MKKNLVINALIGFFLLNMLIFPVSCVIESKSNVLYLYPNDKSQAITIFSNYSKETRLVAVGKHETIPKSNYILLNISKIRKDGDAIGVCWNKNGHRWEMVNNGAEVLKIELDTTKYIFRSSWFKDDRDIPSSTYYENEGCFVVETLDYSKPKPKENGIVERL